MGVLTLDILERIFIRGLIKMFKIFKKNDVLSLNRVHDSVQVVEGNDRLKLYVDADPMRLVAGLNEAQKRLKTIKEEMPEDERNEIARFFASVIFDKEQANDLMEFYHNDAACVINICGQYFSQRLAKKITKAQKKAK